MPTALDRLLASPSALRTLRSIVAAPELSSTCFPTTHGRCSKTSRRPHATKSKSVTDVSRNTDSRYAVIRPSLFERNADNPRQDQSRQTPPTLSDLPTEERQWVQLLQYRERLYGTHGLQQTWNLLDESGGMLPTTSTQDTGFIWSTFLKDPTLFEPLLAHAERQMQQTGQTYPHLYEKCMQYWLPRQPRRAMRYHQLLVLKLKLKTLPLRQISRSTRLNSKALETFLQIYRMSNERDLYDAMVPMLHGEGKFDLARRWHIACHQRGDLPSSAIAKCPVVQLLSAATQSSFQSNTPPSLVAYPKKAPHPILVSQANSKSRADLPKYNEDILRRLQRRDIEPVRFDDAFCARLFATKTFPPSSVIEGLKMVGVNEIGPQAVRTMAIRTEPLSDLQERFKQLRAAGITLQGSVFSVALEKFAMENNLRLMQSMIENDQHADVFEDRKVQENLLDHYLKVGDWSQAHRTLAILSLVYQDSQTESWNLLFQASIRQGNRSQIAYILQDLRVNQVMLSTQSIVALKEMLPSRQRGRRPQSRVNGSFDDLRFVTRTYMTILENSLGILPPRTWREIILRYGMTQRMRELRRLIYWLLIWYAPRDGGTKLSLLPKPPSLDSATEIMRRSFPDPRNYFNLSSALPRTDPRHPIRQLFPPSLHQGLVVWGFRAALVANSALEQSMLPGNAAKKHFRERFKQKGFIRHLDWSVGFRLVVQLRDAGVVVDPGKLMRALQAQFIVLFGRGRSNKIQNRMMEGANTISYHDYARKVNRIWGEPLLYVPELRPKQSSSGMMWHPNLMNRNRLRNAARIKRLNLHGDQIQGGKQFRLPNVDDVNAIPGIPSSSSKANQDHGVRAPDGELAYSQDVADRHYGLLRQSGNADRENELRVGQRFPPPQAEEQRPPAVNAAKG